MRRASNARAVGAQCCSGGRGVGGGFGLSGGCLLFGQTSPSALEACATVVGHNRSLADATRRYQSLRNGDGGTYPTYF